MRLAKVFKLDFQELFKATFKEFFDSDLDKYAAAVAFQMLFSVIPFLIVLIAIIGFIDIEGLYHSHADTVIPGDASEMITQIIADMEQPAGGLIPIALIFALWVASSAMRSITHALNIAYKVEESRPYWSQFLLSVIYTLAVAGLIILAMIFMWVGPQVLEWIAGLVALDEAFITIWTWLRWPVAMILLMLTVAFIYYVAPNVKQRFRKMIPGATIAILVWVGLSVGFDFYMRTFIDLSVLFGGLGAIIFLMIYFYICAAVLLFGAELNNIIERRILSGR
ncbi:YihY/virulence factor BrkB family protein [soil metagenome]